jgi:hypothetical protein
MKSEFCQGVQNLCGFFCSYACSHLCQLFELKKKREITCVQDGVQHHDYSVGKQEQLNYCKITIVKSRLPFH